MKLRFIGIGMASAFWFASAVTASGQIAQDQGNAANPAAEKGSFSILFENDIFYDADHDYTNGVEFSDTTAPDDSPRWVVDTARALPFFNQTGKCARATRWARASLRRTISAQAIRLRPTGPMPVFSMARSVLVDDTGTRLDQLQVMLGVVGPDSLAEETQKFVHSIFRDRKPEGWATQLHNEPGLVIEYNRSIKLIPPQSLFGAVFDIEPNYGAAIGNVYDYASLGAMARLGFNLPRDYGPMRIEPSLPGSDYFEPTAGLGAYILRAWTGARLPAIFLDGNSFQTSRSVDKMNLVGDLILGAAVTFDSFRLAFTHDIRTREYKTQPADDQFGAVDLTFRFSRNEPAWAG